MNYQTEYENKTDASVNPRLDTFGIIGTITNAPYILIT